MSILSNLLFYLVGMWLQKLILISCQKHSGRKTKTLRERYQNTEGAITRSLSVFKSET